jgi:hypothetical protein
MTRCVVPSDFLPRRQYLAERERAELAARKAEQDAKRDPEVEAAVIAFVSHRQGGGGMDWEQFRQEWMKDMPKEGDDGR